jgi:hypothetical protein
MQQNQQEPLNLERLDRWLNDTDTKVILTAFNLAKADIVQLLLVESDNIQDPYLDRRVNHYSGSLRTIQQLLDKQELISLLEDHNLLTREV